MFTAWALTSTALISGLAYCLKRLKEHPVEQSDLDRLYIPILGVRQSGKTLLLATLGSQLTGAATSELTTRLLSHREEEEERGVSLEAFNPNDPDQPILAPGRRTTLAMITLERQSFESNKVNRPTALPESAFFALQFAIAGPLAGRKICTLEDIPGEHMMDEHNHKGNITPKLQRADGLVLIIDGPKALNAEGQSLPEHTLYKQVLEEYFKREHHGPIWVVITKADLLPSDRRDVAWWKAHTLEHITPLLKLRDKDQRAIFGLSLVSAEQRCEVPWEEVRRKGQFFFASLKKVLTDRLEVSAVQVIERARWKKRSLLLALCTLFSIWVSVGSYHLEALPTVQGELTWDLQSLKSSSKPRLELFLDSNFPLSPLSIYRNRLSDELEALREAYWRLVRKHAEQWGHALKAMENPTSERSATLKLTSANLSLALQDARNFNDARADVRQWSHLERELVNYIDDALNTVNQLTNEYDQSDLQKLRKDWQQRCQREAQRLVHPLTFVCAVRDHIQSKESGTRQAALRRAEKTTINDALPVQLSARLSPLLNWSRTYGKPTEDDLKAYFQQSLSNAWIQSWNHLKETLTQEPYIYDPMARLDFLERFEEEAQKLSETYNEALEPPKDIYQSWREHLNKEVVQLRARSEFLSSQDQAEANKLIEWATPHLDPKRRARVNMINKRAYWKTTLREALSSSTADSFIAFLKTIENDLITLSAEEGRTDIEEELQLWDNRRMELIVWSEPERVKLSATKVECNFEKLAAEGLDHGAGSNWDTDIFNPYITLDISAVSTEANENSSQLAIEGDVSPDEERYVKWRPWQPITIQLLERDGDVDRVNEPLDDHPISYPMAWLAPLQGIPFVVNLTPQGSCKVTLQFHHSPPTWLYDLKLLDPL